MKKVNWEEVNDITSAISLTMLIALAPCSLVLLLISLHDNYPPIKWIGYGGLGITVASIIISGITLLIGFICKRKKNKKQKYVEPKVVIRGLVVV